MTANYVPTSDIYMLNFNEVSEVKCIFKKFNTRENNVSTHETMLPAGDKNSK